MGRPRKSVDEERKYRVPKSLQENTKEALDAVSDKALTKLQYSYHLELIESIFTRQDLESNPEGWVAMDAKTVRDTIGGNYKNYLRRLEDAGIFEVMTDSKGRPKYSVTNHEAKQYRLTDTFRHDDEGIAWGIVRKFKNKPKKDITDINSKRLLADVVGYPEYSLHRNWLHKVTVDIEAFNAEGQRWIKEGVLIKGKEYTEKRHMLYLSKLEALNGDAIKFVVGYANKVYTNLTSTPKVGRTHLKVEGYEGTLYQSDLISAHVLLAVPLIKAYNEGLACVEARRELDTVIEMIASKEFYKRLSYQLRAEGVTVKDEKTDFLKHVWNAEEYAYQVKTPYRKAFNRLYPAFNEFIKSQKQGKGGNSKFAKTLSKLESHLFNNRIAHRVAKELGMGTCLLGIFDSFIYKEEDKEAIERIMNEEVYAVTGVRDMVKTTTLREEAEKHIVYPMKSQSCPTLEPCAELDSNDDGDTGASEELKPSYQIVTASPIKTNLGTVKQEAA